MLSCWRRGSLPHSPSSEAPSASPRVSRTPNSPGQARGSRRERRQLRGAFGKASRNCSLRLAQGRDCGAAAAGSGRGGACASVPSQKPRTRVGASAPAAVPPSAPRCPEGLMLATPGTALARGHPCPAASPSHLVGRLSPRWGPCSSGSLPARRSAAAPTRGPPAPPAAARPRSAPPRRPPPPRPRTGTRRAPRRRAGRSPAARRARGSARTAAPGWTSGSSSARPATWRCASLRARGARSAGAQGTRTRRPLRPSPPARLRARGGRAPPPARPSAPSLLPSYQEKKIKNLKLKIIQKR